MFFKAITKKQNSNLILKLEAYLTTIPANHQTKYGRQPAVFDYREILDPENDIRRQIKQSFGPYGPGACLVKNIPGYHNARIKMLTIGNELTRLPERDL